jgi:hypothetical protein
LVENKKIPDNIEGSFMPLNQKLEEIPQWNNPLILQPSIGAVTKNYL